MTDQADPKPNRPHPERSSVVIWTMCRVSGKTLLSRRLSTIMPRMSTDEAMETTRIYSSMGMRGTPHFEPTTRITSLLSPLFLPDLPGDFDGLFQFEFGIRGGVPE